MKMKKPAMVDATNRPQFVAVLLLLTGFSFAQGNAAAGTPGLGAKPSANSQDCLPAATPAVTSLPQVKRIFVDSFGEDPIAAQIQAMVVAQLTTPGRFVVTENRLKADAILKGAGLEKSALESHSFGTG